MPEKGGSGMPERTLGTLNFNENGPIKFSLQKYEEYLEATKEADLDQMIFIWVDESFPDHIRRLCLRNILRQCNDFKKLGANGLNVDHTFDMSFGRLLFCLQDDGGLANIVRYRPKLVEELYHEIMYNLKHGFLDTLKYDHCKDDLDRIIEIIICHPKIDKTLGRKLWHYHRINRNPDLKSLVEFCEQKDIPAWLRDHAKRQLEATLIHELRVHADYYSARGRIDIEYLAAEDAGISRFNNVTAICDHISSSCMHAFLQSKAPSNTFALSDWLIQLLEGYVPKSLTYVKPYHLGNIILLIADQETLYSFARRHILALAESEYTDLCSHNSLIALHYVRDITRQRHIEDAVFLDRLNEVIAYCEAKLCSEA